MEIGIFTGDFLRFIPYQRMRAKHGLPVKLHKMGLPLLVDEPEGMHPEAFHHTEAARNSAIRHRPHDHMRRLLVVRHEVPKRIMGCSGLRHLIMRLRLQRMNQIREFNRILDEEYGNVVADQIIVAFFGIKFRSKAPRIAHGLC
ncbi:hypothetical protein D3C77_292650 [compost metagenome]